MSFVVLHVCTMVEVKHVGLKSKSQVAQTLTQIIECFETDVI